MTTVVLGQPSPELEMFLARRHAMGQDLFDEVWEGSYHATPAANAWHGYVDNVLAELLSPLGRAVGLVGTGPFNLGRPEDYRVPDRGSHRRLPGEVWVATCAIVVEVLSPNDETWEKFDFYFLRDVDEICIADPERAELRWFARDALAHGSDGVE